LEALGNGFHLVENVDLVAEARRLKEALLLLPREARLEVLKELGFCQICGSAEFAKCSCMLNC
jgi:hypothetical protein